MNRRNIFERFVAILPSVFIIMSCVMFTHFVNAANNDNKCTYNLTTPLAVPSVTYPTGSRTHLYSTPIDKLPDNITPVVTTLGRSKGLDTNLFRYFNNKVLVGPANFVYYNSQGGLTGTMTIDGGDLAYVEIPKAVYYYDSTDSKYYLPIRITLTSLKLVPFSGRGCRNDSHHDKYSYAVLSYRGKVVHSSSRIMYNSHEVGGDDDCAANFVAKYRINIVGAPNNIAFLWRFSDLDQPDKTGSGNSYTGTYTESITFDSGFWGSGTVVPGTGLKVSGETFKASCESNGTIDSNNFLTSVWRYQHISQSFVTWVGTRGVETGITGTITHVPPPPPPVHACVHANGYYFGKLVDGQSHVVHYLTFLNECKEYDYTGDYCDASNEKVEAFCNNSEKTVNDSVIRNKETLDEINGNGKKFESNRHTSCKMNESITLDGEYYFSDPYTKSVVVDGVLQSSPCVKIKKISVPIVLTENIKLKVGSLSNLHNNTIYAGGGFGFGGAELTNYVNWLWRYQRKRKDTNDEYQRVFYVEFAHTAKIKEGNEDVYLPVSSGYYNFNDLSLFKDDKCQNKWTYDDIDAKIRKKIIEGSYVNAGVNLDQKFKASTDSNDADVKDAIFPLDKGINNPIVSDNATGNGYIKTVQNSVNIKRAYIDRKTAKVTYGNSTNDMIDAGSLYYVPLKYTDDIFSIYFGNAGNGYVDNSFSVIGQNKKSFQLKCDIGVEHILYEKDKNSGRLKTALRYRPIKNEDVFNGKNKADVAKKAQNWAVWYCGNDSSCKSSNDNKIRIEKTYEDSGCYNTDESGKCNKPLYRVLLNNDTIPKIRSISNSTAYNDFSSIGINGVSSFVTTKDYGFNAIASNESYCNLGGFDASVCDKKRSGGS